MFDLSIGKLLVIGLIALFLVGPDKLPQYAAQLGRWVRIARGLADGAKQRLADEMGPEFDEVAWSDLDPRRYHPKRLLAEAWNAPGEQRPVDRDGPAAAAALPAAAAEQEVDLLALADERADREAVLLERRSVPRG